MRVLMVLSLLAIFCNCAVSQEKPPEKDAGCYVVRKIVPEARRDIGDVKLEKYVLYDICPDGDTEETVYVVRRGVTKSVKARLVKTFKNGPEARAFAAKYELADTPFAEIADCQIIRVVRLPLWERSVAKTKPEIALLNTCIQRESELETLPKITLVRNGQRVVREYWDIRAFKDRAEALEYAEENALTDVDLAVPKY